MVLEDFHGHDLIGAFLPALDHLAEGAAAQELEYLILRTQSGSELQSGRCTAAGYRGLGQQILSIEMRKYIVPEAKK